MTADVTLLMSLKGNLIIGVKTTTNFKMADLVRARMAIDAGVYDQAYDMNNDGILDQSDFDLLRVIVLKNIFG